MCRPISLGIYTGATSCWKLVDKMKHCSNRDTLWVDGWIDALNEQTPQEYMVTTSFPLPRTMRTRSSPSDRTSRYSMSDEWTVKENISVLSAYTCKELAGTSRPVRAKRWLGLIMDVWRGFYGSNSQINQLLLYNSLRGALQILQFMNEWKGLKFIQKITTTFNANPQIYIP